MNKIITVLLLIIHIDSFSQQVPQKTPTQFDNFIMKPVIEWAAYNNDTIRFTENNLSKILRERFEKAEISASLPVMGRSESSNNIKYASKQEIATFYPSIQTQSPDIYFDSAANDLLDVIEIIFIEKGKLQSYTAWVSPKLSVVTEAGIRLGYAQYFSSCFNYKRHFTPSSQDKIISLGQTKRMIKTDSVPSINMLKELYGKNIIETLWPFVLNDQLEIYSIETNKKLTPAELNTDFIYNPISLPVYDSTGKLTGRHTSTAESISPGIFTAVELKQDWFYDQKKNIVFNKIGELILYAKTFKNLAEEEAEPKPLFKIVFK